MNKKRWLERIPALVSWSILLFPLIFAWQYPVSVAFFLAAFVYLWFFRTMEYIIFLLYSFYKFKKILKKDFNKRLQDWETGTDLPKRLVKKRDYLQEHNQFLCPSKVKHIVLVATCGEDIEVLRDTIQSVQDSNFDMQKVVVVLATEARMEPESKNIADQLKAEFSGAFAKFESFAHPDGIAGEVRGKGGNITHSGREITKTLEAEGADLSEYLVTTLDADNRFHPEYLNSLTLKYVQTLDRQKSSYQPLPLFFNNIWDVPMINRMIAIAGGFWHMVESARPHRLHNFSSHAQPLLALKEMDFWAVDTIVEDGHQYWRSYFHFKGDYRVEPLFVPIYQDAVMNTNWKTTMVAQYKQIRRWAWGSSDIPFVLEKWQKNFSELKFWDMFVNFMRLFESHIFWATGAIIITLATPMPELLNFEYAELGYPYLLDKVFSFFFKGAFIGIFLMMLISILTLPVPKKKINYLFLILQWVFIPIMTIGFGAIPAIEAQTRLFFGKYLGFNVTEKLRKKEE
jgi:hypothetical protein